MKKYVLILLGIIISNYLCPALATTYYVNPGQSIQTVIDSASYGDTVEVAAGTYAENITLANGVALIGAGASSTTIDPNGGTVVYNEFCDPNTKLTGFTITGASGSTFGGGIYNYYSDPTITNCAFVDNSASYGGAMRNHFSDPTITNCVFSGNSAILGAGVSNNNYCYPTFTNCTFSQNSASDEGGAMRNYNSAPTITNCIMFHNTADISGDEISNVGSTPVISHSDIAGCGSSAAWDTSFGTDAGGNKDVDPLFVREADDGGDGWGDDPCTPADESANDDYGDLHLADGSPFIDAGDNSALIANPLDLDGNPRISNSVVDMGAYEVVCPCSLTGDFDCSCGVDGVDFAILASAWLTQPADAAWNTACDISAPADDIVDIQDAKVFAGNWLTFVDVPEPDVAHWTMDDNADNTTVSDSSGNENHGTAQQNTSNISITGRIDGALSFNDSSSSDYIQIADSDPLSPTQEITVCGWFYFNDASENVGLIWKHHYNYTLWTSGGSVRFAVWNPSAEMSRAFFSTSLLGSGWNFIAGVFDGTNSILYLNGEQVGTLGASITGGIKDSAGDLYIGQRSDGTGDRYFDGKIDDVKIFDRALSEAEILQLATDF